MTPVTPAHADWYLFLDASPVDAGFERALRGVLREPSVASFAWVRYAGGSLTVKLTPALVPGGEGEADVAYRPEAA